ncbi:hypothetical protein O181_090417 [Austropuccinia psidii MF-1]|uniref:Uncharacterized protein n=1 Tax=Austropuccinia psidii MF-1 TaxID=1389203 RepID=A0A9Q3P7N5_9BASI|nr:hypothetical protein [Austropuccinia psidii MF-1]
MTSIRTESIYSIQSNGSGPGHSSHKSKIQECHPEERNKWRMPELPPVAKEVVKIYQSQCKNWLMVAKHQEQELLPTLWIGKMNSYLQLKKFLGPEKTWELLKCLTPMSFKGKFQKTKAWLKKPKHIVRGSEEAVGPKEQQQPCGSSSILNKQKYTSTSVQRKEIPKEQSEGPENCKAQMEQALPSELQNTKERKTTMDNVCNMGRNFVEFKNKEEKKMDQ